MPLLRQMCEAVHTCPIHPLVSAHSVEKNTFPLDVHPGEYIHTTKRRTHLFVCICLDSQKLIIVNQPRMTGRSQQIPRFGSFREAGGLSYFSSGMLSIWKPAIGMVN